MGGEERAGGEARVDWDGDDPEANERTLGAFFFLGAAFFLGAFLAAFFGAWRVSGEG